MLWLIQRSSVLPFRMELRLWLTAVAEGIRMFKLLPSTSMFEIWGCVLQHCYHQCYDMIEIAMKFLSLRWITYERIGLGMVHFVQPIFCMEFEKCYEELLKAIVFLFYLLQKRRKLLSSNAVKLCIVDEQQVQFCQNKVLYTFVLFIFVMVHSVNSTLKYQNKENQKNYQSFDSVKNHWDLQLPIHFYIYLSKREMLAPHSFWRHSNTF